MYSSNLAKIQTMYKHLITLQHRTFFWVGVHSIARWSLLSLVDDLFQSNAYFAKECNLPRLIIPFIYMAQHSWTQIFSFKNDFRSFLCLLNLPSHRSALIFPYIKRKCHIWNYSILGTWLVLIMKMNHQDYFQNLPELVECY